MEGQVTTATTNSTPSQAPSSTDGTAAVANGSGRGAQAPKTQTNPITANQNQQNGQVKTDGAPATTQAPQYFDVKVNGQVRKMTLEQLMAKASLADASYERFQQAAQKEKNFQQWKEKAKQDALSALMDPELGLTKDQIRQKFEAWYKQEFIDPETLSPEQRRAQELEREIKQYKEREKQIQEQQQQQEMQRLDQETRVRIQKTIFEALESGKLPKTRFTAARLAHYMKLNNKAGYNAPMDVLIQQVADERNTLIKEQADSADGETLYNMLGKDNVTKLQRYALQLITGKPVQTPQPPKEPVNGSRDKKVYMGDVDEYFRNMRVKR